MPATATAATAFRTSMPRHRERVDPQRGPCGGAVRQPGRQRRHPDHDQARQFGETAGDVHVESDLSAAFLPARVPESLRRERRGRELGRPGRRDGIRQRRGVFPDGRNGGEQRVGLHGLGADSELLLLCQYRRAGHRRDKPADASQFQPAHHVGYSPQTGETRRKRQFHASDGERQTRAGRFLHEPAGRSVPFSARRGHHSLPGEFRGLRRRPQTLCAGLDRSERRFRAKSLLGRQPHPQQEPAQPHHGLAVGGLAGDRVAAHQGPRQCGSFQRQGAPEILGFDGARAGRRQRTLCGEQFRGDAFQRRGAGAVRQAPLRRLEIQRDARHGAQRPHGQFAADRFENRVALLSQHLQRRQYRHEQLGVRR